MRGSRAKKLRKEAKAIVLAEKIPGSNAVAKEYKRLKKEFKSKPALFVKPLVSRRQQRIEIAKNQPV